MSVYDANDAVLDGRDPFEATVPREGAVNDPRSNLAPMAGLPESRPLVLGLVGRSSLYLVRSPRDDGSYVEVNEKHLWSDFSRMWPDATRFVAVKDGSRPATPTELYELHGRRCDQMLFSAAGEPRFEADDVNMGGRLWQRVWQQDARLVARQHPVVDEWLAAFAGPQLDTLLDWLATSTQLTRPTSALILKGENSAGKGMLLGALRAMYGGSAVSYLDIAGNFSEGLLQSPIVGMDEGLPRKKSGDSVFFRSLIGEDKHTVTRKNRVSVTLHGCPRLVIPTNSEDPLLLAEEGGRSSMDEAAIARRFLHIDVQEEAATFLEQAGGVQRTRSEGWVTAPDGSPGLVAQHILWLSRTRSVRAGSRFLVEGDASEWLARLARTGGPEQRVLIAIAYAVLRDGGYDGAPWGRRPVLVRKGEALVVAKQLWSQWHDLAGEDRRPSLQKLGASLAKIGQQWRPRAPLAELAGDLKGVPKRPRLWVVPAGPICEAAAQHAIGDEEVLEQRFELAPVREEAP